MSNHGEPAQGRRPCAACGRPMTPRRRWRNNWPSVRYCSGACRARGVDDTGRRLEAAIRELLAARARGASICPSEAARRVAPGGDWRALMEPARRAARRLVHAGEVQILQSGRVIDPGSFRGPIRIRARG